MDKLHQQLAELAGQAPTGGPPGGAVGPRPARPSPAGRRNGGHGGGGGGGRRRRSLGFGLLGDGGGSGVRVGDTGSQPARAGTLGIVLPLEYPVGPTSGTPPSTATSADSESD
jgi:hypothetical protein